MIRRSMVLCVSFSLCLSVSPGYALSWTSTKEGFKKPFVFLKNSCVNVSRASKDALLHPYRSIKNSSSSLSTKFCKAGIWGERTGFTAGVNLFGGLMSAGANTATAIGVFTRGR